MVEQGQHNLHTIRLNSTDDPPISLQCCIINLTNTNSIRQKAIRKIKKKNTNSSDLHTSHTYHLRNTHKERNIEHCILIILLTDSLRPLTGSFGMILVQSIPIRKTLIPVSLANFISVSGSDQNLNLSSLKSSNKTLKLDVPKKAGYVNGKKNYCRNRPF